ncbi:MAG: hypothetical protein IPK74_24960 [Deltaproteobacteria bacterium]|nr:hypothetical protein [Deltaproteobacteria bacterium]
MRKHWPDLRGGRGDAVVAATGSIAALLAGAAVWLLDVAIELEGVG